MLTRSTLPDSITLGGGEVLAPVIGGHLEQEPFLTVAHSGVDVKQNGWANGLFESQERRLIISEAKRQGLKYRVVGVLSRNLRGKRDLGGQPYQPSVFVFVEVKGAPANA